MTRSRPRRPVPRRAEAPGLAARMGALALLDQVLDGGGMLTDRAGGSGPERAEARGLADLALRRLGQIDAVLAQFVDRPPKGKGRQILRLMAAELLFAGTPPHAAVDLAVRAAQSAKGTARLAGLINAVGRRVAEQGPAMVEAQDAAGMNIASWLRKLLAADWGKATAAAIAKAHLTPAPHDLTLANPEDAKPLAVETGGELLPTGSIRLPGRPQITLLPGYAQGAWWVQDAAAALPAQLVPAPGGKRVLDLCAAPGGKTLQLAAAGAQVTALDISEARLERVSQNLERTGLSAEIVTADAFDWEPEAPFDAVLLDAPCSATGTIRRHPDLPHRFDPDAIIELKGLQLALLERAMDWVAPGGHLVYCTCSLLKDEGEEVVADMPSKGLHLDPIGPRDGIPEELISPDGTLRTRPDMWPDRGGMDGFFAARLVREA